MTQTPEPKPGVWRCRVCNSEVTSVRLPLGWYALRRRIRVSDDGDCAPKFASGEGVYCRVTCLLSDGSRLRRREGELNVEFGLSARVAPIPSPRDVAARVARRGGGSREDLRKVGADA